MSEQSQGPGWWLASDGRWYPPELAPGVAEPPPSPQEGSPSEIPGFERTAIGWEPIETRRAPDGQGMPSQPSPGTPWASAPPPAPPSQGTSAGSKVAIVAVCVVVFLFVGSIAAVTLLGSNAESKFEAVGGRIGGDTIPGSALAPASPEGYTVYNDPDGEFVMNLAPGWVGAPLRGDTAGLGRRVSPDHEQTAQAIDAAVGALPRQVVLFGIDKNDVGIDDFSTNLNVLSVPRGGASLEQIEAEAPGGVAAFGAVDVTTSRIQLGTGEGLRLEFSYSREGALAGAGGVQYYVLTEDAVWILTFASDVAGGYAATFDAMAAGFRPS